MRNKVLPVLGLGMLLLSGCGNTASTVESELVSVGGMIVSAECSPQLSADGTVLVNILKIVAPDANTANTVSGILSTNQAVATQLCPLVQAVEASVGTVPSGTPVTVTTTPPTAESLAHPLPIIKGKGMK